MIDFVLRFGVENSGFELRHMIYTKSEVLLLIYINILSRYFGQKTTPKLELRTLAAAIASLRGQDV